MFRKGQFVRHSKAEVDNRFGLGIVVNDQYADRVLVFFENELRTVEISLEFASLTLTERSENSAAFLENALYEDKGDRVPFPQILSKFLDDFEGGFYGPVYERYEREDKVKMHQFVLEWLSKERFEQALGNNDFTEIAKSIKNSFSLKGFSLLATFEMMKIHTAFKAPENHQDLTEIFFNLLYAEASIEQRIEKARTDLEKYEMAKWPIITFPLFARYPDLYLFVKPEMTQKAAANRGYDIQYSSQVNAGTYKRILAFAADLQTRLTNDAREELTPRDMIDVQSFMWCTFAGGWTAEGIQNAKMAVKSN